jgi:epoxyqueuosine reductase
LYCIDACPQAIVGPYVVDGSKCISYFTIELKRIFRKMKRKFEDWVFGCDICQDVCPGIFSKPHNEPLFNPNIDVLSMTRKDWEITEETLVVFKDSPLKNKNLEV